MTTNHHKQSTNSATRRWITATAGLVVIALAGFFFVVPDLVGRHMNAVHNPPPYHIDDTALALHRRIIVADLHADTLLWNRDLLQRGAYGHIDLPRMLEAHMGLQVFSAVTKTPRGLNFEHNDANSDNITALVIAQRWPLRTWDSRAERALHQAARLHRLASRSRGQFTVITNRQDLERYLERRRAGATVTAGLLAIEGLHALDGTMVNLRRLHQAGFRIMGLTHFFDNAVGGSAHGVAKGGLTEFGRTVLVEMERLRIIVDLAHASPQLIVEVLALASRPVVVSHTGVKGTCDRTRNLSDAQLHAIADNGGLIGIAFFEEAVCGRGVAAIAAAIAYTAGLIGVEHVALGSDFDGAVTVPFDITGLPQLTSALSGAGFSPAEVTAIMGGNILDLLAQGLPTE